MTQTDRILEYECPCCGATLSFGAETQQMTCQYCDNTFELDTVKAFQENKKPIEPEPEHWETAGGAEWSEAEYNQVTTYTCQSCGGELITDDQTAATFCPYCGNATILPGRLSGGMKPDAVIPFQTTKEVFPKEKPW